MTNHEITGKTLEYSFDFDFCNLFENLLDRIDRDEIADADGDYTDIVYQAIDDGMIYNSVQWTAYRFYCNPGDPLDQMFDGLTDDLLRACEIIAEDIESEKATV